MPNAALLRLLSQLCLAHAISLHRALSDRWARSAPWAPRSPLPRARRCAAPRPCGPRPPEGRPWRRRPRAPLEIVAPHPRPPARLGRARERGRPARCGESTIGPCGGPPSAACSSAKAWPRRASRTGSRGRPAASWQLSDPAGERRQAGDATDLDLPGLGQRARGGDADPQAGERARPEADGDPLDRLPAAALLRRSARPRPAAAPEWRGRPSAPGPCSASASGFPPSVTATERTSVAVSNPSVVIDFTHASSAPMPRPHEPT